MKRIILLLLFLTFQQIFSNEIFNISLNENEKLEGTSTIALNKTTSLHLLFVKNSKTSVHIIRPFFVDIDKKVSQLEDAVFDNKINLISSHYNGNVVTIGNYDEENETLYIVDIDALTKKSTQKTYDNYRKPKLIFNLEGKTIFVIIADDNKSIHTDIIKNTNQITGKDFYPSDEIVKDFKKMVKLMFPPIEAINQNEFVKNGSISSRSAYIINDQLFFISTFNSLKTEVFSFDLNDQKNINYRVFDMFFPTSGQDQNVYLFEDKLALIISSKEDLLFVAYDVKTKAIVKHLSLVEKLAGKINMDLFLKEARKRNLKVTMTFNKTKNNNYQVILDRVDKAVYYYRDPFWMGRMQMQMIQQQQMRAMQPMRFGPNDTFFNNIYLEAEYASLVFYMDANFNVIDEDKSGTVYKYLDKDALLKPYEDDKNIKELSAAFLDNEFRFVYQNKDTKQITINYEIIK
jgi:hypothetical protein